MISARTYCITLTNMICFREKQTGLGSWSERMNLIESSDQSQRWTVGERSVKTKSATVHSGAGRNEALAESGSVLPSPEG
jgi:hypothetical protein